MKEDLLIRTAEHPTLPITCFSDGTVIRHTHRKDSSRQTYGNYSGDGYYIVRLGKRGYYVHRVIAEAFLPNPENKPTVDHIDRDKTNNSLWNLRWATVKEQADNRAFVESRHETSVRACDDLVAYTRERRAFVKEHGHGYGKRPVIDDEAHRKQRERNARYRAKNPGRLKEISHNYYLRRKAKNESR